MSDAQLVKYMKLLKMKIRKQINDQRTFSELQHELLNSGSHLNGIHASEIMKWSKALKIKKTWNYVNL